MRVPNRANVRRIHMGDRETSDELSILGSMQVNVMGLLDEMPGGFFIYHADGDESLIYANDACLRIFGCETLDQFKSLTGFTFPGMVHPDDLGSIEESIARQIRNDRHKMDYVEYRINTLDGSVRWIQDYGHYVSTEAGDFFYVFINDATERLRERMEQLERMNKDLAEAFGREREHKDMLRKALQQANVANIAKTTFLNNMSHNIRTLLNAITGYSHMIFGHAKKADLVREYSQHIVEASDQLLEVVAETLEVSRLESGSSQLVEEECSLSEIVSNIKAAFVQRAVEEGKDLAVEAHTPDDSPIIADVHCINQIVTQLMDNAFKYTSEGDVIRLLVEEEDDASTGHAKVKILLSDSGIGMSPDFIDHMFEPFERSGNTTDTGIIGTGLGLTIVKYIVDMLSGSIDVSSKEGEGTTIKVVLTLKLASKCDVGDRSPKRHGGRYKVLVAEDNALNREIITCLLEDCGHQVSSVVNGKEAVEAIASSAPGDFDVVLMDIQMPVLNGYDATSRIRRLKDDRLASIPIIAVTSDAFPEDRKRSFSCGMNEHIPKPINIDVLNAAMDSVV